MGIVADPQAVVADYLNHLTVERASSPHTVLGYRCDLREYLRFCEQRGVLDIADATPELVSAFVEWLRSGSPADERQALAAASAARALVAVRGMHAFALREGLLASDPAAQVQPPRLPARLPDALTVEQVEALLAVSLDSPAGRRDRALMEFLYGTGARVSEALGCDLDDLHLEDGVVRLLGKGRKERAVPVGSHAVRALDEYLVRSRAQWVSRGQGSAAVFVNARGGRLSRQSAWTTLRDSGRAAGLPRDIHPHTLRHSFATHLLQGGADIRVVQELLGHASATTTQIYTKVTIDHLREVFLTSHPRARV